MVPHAKGLRGARSFAHVGIHRIHPCGGRSLMDGFQELLYRVWRPLDLQTYGAIWFVAYPAAEVQSACRLTREVPKPDPLHASGDAGRAAGTVSGRLTHGRFGLG